MTRIKIKAQNLSRTWKNRDAAWLSLRQKEETP